MGFNPFVATVGNAVSPLPVAQGGTGGATVAAALASLGLGGPLNLPLPADLGDVAWTADPYLGNASAALTSGTIYAAEFVLRAAAPVAGIGIQIASAGATLTAGESLLGIYDQATGTQQGVTADQSGAWITTGYKPANLLAAIPSLAAGKYWAVMLSVGTTPPSPRVAAASSVLSNGAAPTLTRSGTAGTGQTALPASGLVVAAANALPIMFRIF
jgi:hypothetical protein